jgi:hypothetical protein
MSANPRSAANVARRQFRSFFIAGAPCHIPPGLASLPARLVVLVLVLVLEKSEESKTDDEDEAGKNA